MKNKIHLIMPMAGRGHRFYEKGITIPKPLIEINNKPFFWWATESIVKFIDVADVTFVVLKEHVEKNCVDKEILKYYPTAKIVVLPEVLNGAVLTCINGVEHINDDLPIVFNDCDHLFKSNKFKEFLNTEIDNVDGAILTFKSDDPKFSYIEYDKNKNIIGTVEKEVVSNDAICGAYYFRNKKIFLDGVKKYLNNCNYSEYYVSGVYNILINTNQVVKNYEVDFHLAFGTPEEFEDAKDSKYFEELL